MFNNILDFCMQMPCYQNIRGQYKTNEWRNKLSIMQNYLTLYSNVADYEGLPEQFKEITGKNRMWLAMKFFASAVCFFEHPVHGLQCLPVSGMQKYNIAGLPEEWTCFGFDGTSYKRNASNSVLMFNDYAFSIPFIKLLYNTELMLECDNTHRQNLIAQRQPLIMEMEEDEKKSAEKFVNQLNGEVIKVRKRARGANKRSMDMPYDTKAFESGKQFQGDKLGSDYRFFENRNLTMLGYNNENLEKKERLLVDEVNSNNEVVSSFYTTRIDCEKEAFEKINKMWGYNIKVIPRRLKSFDKGVEDDTSSVVQQGKTAEKSYS